MDELIKFLTSKLGYTLGAILGFGLPGNLFIFVWDRELYLDMNLIKLLILSFAISFVLFIPNILLFVMVIGIIENIRKIQLEAWAVLLLTICFTVLEMIYGMVVRLLNSMYTIVNYIEEIAPVLFWSFVLASIIDCIIAIRKKIKKD